VEYAVRAEEVGLDSVWVSDHYQPWRHTGGHAPFSLAFMTAGGGAHAAGGAGHERADRDVPLQPGGDRAGIRHDGLPLPGRIVLGLGTGEALNETAVTGAEWPTSRAGSPGCARRCG
jgi:hypothetical protein